jgi:hypothetical protein
LGDWEQFADALGEQLHEVDRVSARRYFDALMAASPERGQQLETLLARNGIGVSTQDEGLRVLAIGTGPTSRPPH